MPHLLFTLLVRRPNATSLVLIVKVFSKRISAVRVSNPTRRCGGDLGWLALSDYRSRHPPRKALVRRVEAQGRSSKTDTTDVSRAWRLVPTLTHVRHDTGHRIWSLCGHPHVDSLSPEP